MATSPSPQPTQPAHLFAHDSRDATYTIEVVVPPYRSITRMPGFHATPRPGWTAQQLAAWRASHALIDAWLALGELRQVRGRTWRRWQRYGVERLLTLTRAALEAAIAPLFDDENGEEANT